MEKSIKFLGICFLISSLFISSAIIYSSTKNRFCMNNLNQGGALVTDTFTGETYFMGFDENFKEEVHKFTLPKK